jgi:hypothetical protein
LPYGGVGGAIATARQTANQISLRQRERCRQRDVGGRRRVARPVGLTGRGVAVVGRVGDRTSDEQPDRSAANATVVNVMGGGCRRAASWSLSRHPVASLGSQIAAASHNNQLDTADGNGAVNVMWVVFQMAGPRGHLIVSSDNRRPHLEAASSSAGMIERNHGSDHR